MHFNEMPEDVVYEIFSRMTATELLALERVDRRWQRMVQVTLERTVKTVVMKEPPADESRRVPNLCQHLSDVDPRRMISLGWMFDHLFNKRISKQLRREGVENQETQMFLNIKAPEEIQAFTGILSKLEGIRCIDFGNREIAVQTLNKSFELCPRLECIVIDGKSIRNLIEDDLVEIFKNFGHQLVHFASFENEDSEIVFRVLSRCSKYLRLERLDIEVDNLSEDSVEDIKKLQQPKNAYLVLRLVKISVDSSLDFIDVLEVADLTWNSLPDICQRLSWLSFGTLKPVSEFPEQFDPIDFLNLKHLTIDQVTEITLRVLIRCKFILLKELKMRFILEFVFDLNQLLEQLFEKMWNLTKLEIEDSVQIQNQVPGSAVLKLTRLNEIVWSVLIQNDWNMQVTADLFNAIEQVASLKKLTFNYLINANNGNQWQAAIDQNLNGLKERRPDIVIESKSLLFFII